MITIKKSEVNKGLLVILAITFVLGMFVFSAFTSPIYPSFYGGDSALFTLLGKGIVEGKTIYKDLFDHKGPILFFIEAAGYLLGKTTGILILQCIFGVVNLSLLYVVWKKIKQNSASNVELIIVFIAGCSVFFHTFTYGNLSEEYSLPLISCCILLFVKYAQNCKNDAKHPYSYSFIYGVIITILILIRLNNAVTVLAGVFAIILYLFFKKEYKNMLINLIFGILGMCVAALPVVIYFIYKSALYDMLYATFVYNFKYAGSIGHQSIMSHLPKFAVLYSPIICSVVLIIAKLKKEKKVSFFDFLVSVIVVLNTVCLIISNTYPHYFTIYVPVFVLVISAYFTYDDKVFRRILVAVCVLAHVLSAGYGLAQVVYGNYVLGYPQKTHNDISKTVEQIPQDERDSVIGYEIPCDYYLYADIVPSFKYYTHHKWWSTNDTSIMESFVKYIESDDALWLLTLPNEDDERILKIISEKYVLVEESKYINLYRIKEGR